MWRIKNKKDKGNKMWKSGKVWFYCCGAVLTLGVSSNINLSPQNICFGDQLIHAETSSSQIFYGAPDSINEKQEAEDIGILPDSSRGYHHAIQLRNGSTTNPKKTSVTRTSDGFTALNPTSEIKSFKLSWIKEASEISLNVGNAFYINTPYSMDIELNQPLLKNKSVQVKVDATGEIFNKTSHSSNWHTAKYTGQNNGNYFESPDHSFSYDYDENTGMLTITALTDANLSKFTGLTYMLASKGSGWVPVPLSKTPYPLEGGTAGNYGQIGSGGTLTIKVGDQSTSETVTNLDDTHFSENLVQQSTDLISRGNVNLTSIARASDNFLSPLTNIIQQTNGGKVNLLDGSMDHYEFTPAKNAELVEKAKKDPYAALRFEAYIPMGSDTINKTNNSVIFSGSNPSEFQAFKNVFKNANYDDKTGKLEFDLSKDPLDWANLAKALLAIPSGSAYYDRVQLPYVKAYLQAMANENNKIGDTLYLHLYPISPQAYNPINYNNEISINAKVTNTKSKKTVSDTLTVSPVSAGEAEATKASLISQYVDAKTGKPIGEGIATIYKSLDESWTITPAIIKGYAYVSTNDHNLLDKIGLTEVINPQGTVNSGMLGKQSTILFAYTNEGTITSHFVDTKGQEIQSKRVTAGNDGSKPDLGAPEIKNYELKTGPTIPDFVAGKNQDITYIYDNKAPITYTVIDDTNGKVLEGKQPLFTGTIGTSGDTDKNIKLLGQIEKTYTERHYKIGEIKNKDLPAPTNTKGYDVEIHLTHGTTKKVVAGEDAKNSIVSPKITRTIHYQGLSSKIPKDEVQTACFDSKVTQTIDAVTGTILSESDPQWFKVGSDVDKAELESIRPPEIEGYTASLLQVPTLEVNHASQNIEVNVTYTPHPSEVKIIYRDIDVNATSDAQVLKQEIIQGHVDETFDNQLSLQKEKEALENKGYEWVHSDEQTGVYTPNVQTRYVDFKHKVLTTPDYQTKDVTQTIHYQTESGIKAAPDNLQVFHFTNGAAIDQVTKAVIKNNWSKVQTSKEVKSPLFEGYTPEIEQIKGQNYNNESKNQSLIVKYRANSQKLVVQFIDVGEVSSKDYKEGKNLSYFELKKTGKSDETYDNTQEINEKLQLLKDNGYQLIEQETGGQKGKFDHDDSKTQIYHVYLKLKKTEKPIAQSNFPTPPTTRENKPMLPRTGEQLNHQLEQIGFIILMGIGLLLGFKKGRARGVDDKKRDKFKSSK